jgi:DNA-binding MarR family transcriptional regulator
VTTIRANAQRLLQLFGAIRHVKGGAAFRRLHELNLSFSHMRMMHLLAPDKILAMKDLAEQLNMTPPSVTALTRRLVQAGLIQRHHHPQDQRVVLLSLTDDGRQFLAEMSESQLRRMELLLQGLSPDEQHLFIGLMERAVQAMRAEDEEQDVVLHVTATASNEKVLT